MVEALADTPEFDAVRSILAGSRPPEGVIGPGDDAAVLSDGTLVSTDTSVEGVHFRLDWVGPKAAGGRACRAALSDLAAMGGEPVAVLASLSGPDRRQLIEAGQGVREAGERFGAPLVGGDLAPAEGPLTIGVTVVGRLGDALPWLRSGARPGDALYVTGALGGAAAAVAAWEVGDVATESHLAAFLLPVPHLKLVPALRELLRPSAAIDLSDGLAADARHLARASGVSMTVEGARVPIAETAALGRDPVKALDLALRGGEDYELLLTAPDRPGAEEAVRSATGVRLTRVGLVEPGEGVTLRSPDGTTRPLDGGFGHWTVG